MNEYYTTGTLPLTVGEPITLPQKALTRQLYNALETTCNKHDATIPDSEAPRWFWGLYLGNEDGGSVDWQDATYACLEVYDFDGLHNFDWLNKRLAEVGIAIPSLDAKLEGEGETEWGRCPIYAYNLPLDKTPDKTQQ